MTRKKTLSLVQRKTRLQETIQHAINNKFSMLIIDNYQEQLNQISNQISNRADKLKLIKKVGGLSIY